MGSITEEQLFHQRIIDFTELRPPASPISAPSSKPLSPMDHPPYLTLLQEILGRATEDEVKVCEKILRDVEMAWEPTNLNKWLVTTLKMDGYEASLCKTSWVSTFGLSKCPPKVIHHYEYIDVMVRDKSSGRATRLIVDMDFRSQFEVARATAAYKELTNAIPSVFVGSEERLNKIISLLCSAAKRSLRESRLHVPPWRKATYMKAKWLSKDCKKVSASPNMDLGVVG
ncbi:uncharacterized protein LOC133866796 isoform X2 [Alnus glutinosa]|uniref:uncharacterized protein LOC133866796 isoform X2 n=1 Tax=Alnus glutinosa TaxID=3517 RepID=UPI002D797463|nr:uncharacterized protein LOC133866796 isoform X2 [Alnus glutinosa]